MSIDKSSNLLNGAARFSPGFVSCTSSVSIDEFLKSLGNSSNNEESSCKCNCKASLVAALKLLCDPSAANYINFEEFAFINDNIIVGSTLSAYPYNGDNLGALTAQFKNFSPCSCDTVEISGTIAEASLSNGATVETQEEMADKMSDVVTGLIETGDAPESVTALLNDLLTALKSEQSGAILAESFNTANQAAVVTNYNVSKASLCNIGAIAFGVKADSAGAEPVAICCYTDNYTRVKESLESRIGRITGCGECTCNCNCDDCCCSSGILSILSTNNLSRTASLAADRLLLQEVTVIGNVGNVLVLANDEKRRFYFVCANKIDYIA